MGNALLTVVHYVVSVFGLYHWFYFSIYNASIKVMVRNIIMFGMYILVTYLTYMILILLQATPCDERCRELCQQEWKM